MPQLSIDIVEWWLALCLEENKACNNNLKGGREGVSTQRHQGANQAKDNISWVVIRERQATLIMANPLGTGWFSCLMTEDIYQIFLVRPIVLWVDLEKVLGL